MLEDRVVEWTREWQREGAERGRKQVLSEMRTVLVRPLEARFGPLSPEARQRLEEIDSAVTLAEMMGRIPLAQSLNDLGLG
jgi:hypothetical protein